MISQESLDAMILHTNKKLIMKTAMQEIIEKFTEAQRFIISNNQYAKGYDGALIDCIKVAESFVKKEKEQIEEAYCTGGDLNYLIQETAEEYYNKNYKK